MGGLPLNQDGAAIMKAQFNEQCHGIGRAKRVREMFLVPFLLVSEFYYLEHR